MFFWTPLTGNGNTIFSCEEKENTYFITCQYEVEKNSASRNERNKKVKRIRLIKQFKTPVGLF